jgi:hypothetical protein
MPSEIPQLTVLEWSSYFTSSVLILLYSFALIRIARKSKVEFMIYLLAMLITSNVSFVLYVSVFNARRVLLKDPATTKAAELPLVSFSVACDFLRYITLQISMWCFSFKYWVVSVEVPKAI